MYGVFKSRFPQETAKERLDLKSRDGPRLRSSGPGTPSSKAFVHPLRLFRSSRLQGKLGSNGGTEGAPRGRGPLFNITYIISTLDRARFRARCVYSGKFTY